MSKHPLQPLERDSHGVLRFKENRAVSALYEQLRTLKFDPWIILARDPNVTKDDLRQFAQLIGYSVSGASELSYMDEETLEAAQNAFDLESTGIDETKARNIFLEERHEAMIEAVKSLAVATFAIHEDDLEPR